MIEVSCEQLRYTWAERRLEGSGGGFGVVLRSADWPADLVADPAMHELLTGMDPDLRAASPETAAPLVAHLRWRDGSVLVAKRPVGQDGAGRPGNYAVHALYDAGGTLGALDLAPLVAAGAFVLERAVDIDPCADAPTVTVRAAPDWRSLVSRPQSVGGRPGAGPIPGAYEASGAYGGYGDHRLTYRDPAEVADLLGGLCLRLPADLVNQLEIDRVPATTGTGQASGGQASGGQASAGEAPSGGVDRLVGLFAEAVGLGVVEQDVWWTRRGEPVDAWLTRVRGFVTMNQPVRRVPDDLLWTRWDRATVRGRVIVAEEVIARGPRLLTSGAAAEVAARPGLLDEILEAGLKGGSAARATAAEWAATAGDDARVLDVAAELHHLGDDQALSRTLLDRLQQFPPDGLRPASLAEYVATRLDGAAPLDPAWRAHCLELRLSGRLTCAHPEELITSSSERDLAAACRDVRAAGTGLETCWANLAPLPWPSRAKIVLATGADAAEYLLRRDIPQTGGPSREQLIETWPQIARTAGWSSWARRLPTDLESRVRQLRAQRLVLLIVVGVLVVAAVVLGLL